MRWQQRRRLKKERARPQLKARLRWKRDLLSLVRLLLFETATWVLRK